MNGWSTELPRIPGHFWLAIPPFERALGTAPAPLESISENTNGSFGGARPKPKPPLLPKPMGDAVGLDRLEAFEI